MPKDQDIGTHVTGVIDVKDC